MNRNELILEIVKKSLEINTRKKNTIFFEYFGHVNMFKIDIDLKGWAASIEADFKSEIYMDLLKEEEIIEKLKEVLNYLNGMEV